MQTFAQVNKTPLQHPYLLEVKPAVGVVLVLISHVGRVDDVLKLRPTAEEVVKFLHRVMEMLCVEIEFPRS